MPDLRNRASALGIAFALAATTTGDLAAQHGWTQLQPNNHPSARGFCSMVFDWNRNECVLFGGWDGNPFGETWLWDGNDWAQANPTTSPPARCCHMMAYDVARGVTVVFGGTVGNSTDMNDTWEWDGTNWTLMSPQTSPAGRRVAGMAYDMARGVTVMFGGQFGFQSTGATDETWEWNGSNWTQRTPQNSPAARSTCSLSYDLTRNVCVLYGGEMGPTGFTDTWEWDGFDWTQRTTTQNPNVGSRLRSVGGWDNTVLVCGQVLSPSTFPSTTWLWTGSEWVEDLSPSPPGRSVMPLAFDINRNVVVTFGGYGGVYRDDTWEYDPGLPASYTAFGSGCAGSLGVPSLAAAPGSRPAMGTTFRADIDNLPNGLAVIATGLSNTTTTTGQSLPLDLTFLGMPGCSLLADPIVLQTVVGAGNSAQWVWQLPNAANLYGVTFYNQALSLDLNANPFGVTVSNGAEGVLRH